MKGVATRYPQLDAQRGLLNLEARINLCRTERQDASPLAYESRELLALTAFVANQSRGQPIAVHAPESLLEKGPRGHGDSAGASDGLSNLSARMAGGRITAATATQLPDWNSCRNTGLRDARAGRARVVPHVARARHAARNTCSAALIWCTAMGYCKNPRRALISSHTGR